MKWRVKSDKNRQNESAEMRTKNSTVAARAPSPHRHRDHRSIFSFGTAYLLCREETNPLGVGDLVISVGVEAREQSVGLRVAQVDLEAADSGLNNGQKQTAGTETEMCEYKQMRQHMIIRTPGGERTLRLDLRF